MQFVLEIVCLISVNSLLCFKGNGGAAAAPQNGAAMKGNGNFKIMELLLLNGSKCDLYGDRVPLTLSANYWPACVRNKWLSFEHGRLWCASWWIWWTSDWRQWYSMQLWLLGVDCRGLVCVGNLMHDLCFWLLEGNGGTAQNGPSMKGNGKSLHSFDFLV